MCWRRNTKPQPSPLPIGKSPSRLARFKPSRAQIVSGALIFSAGMLALAAVPNVFTAGTAISSSAVNANFSALDTRMAAAETAISGVVQSNSAFGNNTGIAISGGGAANTCVMGEVKLLAGVVYDSEMLPAKGQLLPIINYQALFSLVGTNYGGDGKTTFALPDLRAAAPNNMTYVICVAGVFP